MALDRTAWTHITDAMALIRSHGCAVCVFTPDDAESMVAESCDEDDASTHTGLDNVQSVEFIQNNRKHIEDAMCRAGNESMEVLLSFDGLL